MQKSLPDVQSVNLLFKWSFIARNIKNMFPVYSFSEIEMDGFSDIGENRVSLGLHGGDTFLFYANKQQWNDKALWYKRNPNAIVL